MENSRKHTSKLRAKRVLRVRKWIRGNQEKPRLCVVKSNKNIYVQIIDDEKAITLVNASTLSKNFRSEECSKPTQATAKQLGLKIAELAKAQSITRVAFDRGRSKYHGVVAAVADGAREGGLEF